MSASRLSSPPVLLLLLLAWALLYWSLAPLADALVSVIPGLTPGAHFTESLRFFVFEVPKVLLLLVLIVFAVGIVRTWFSPERTRALLGGRSLLLGNVLGSLLGIVTPFCSCSAVPLFIGFVKAGVPLGATFSFLIAAPMINEVAVILLFGMFGWKVALTYVLAGLLVAIVAGQVIGRFKLERYVEPWVTAGPTLSATYDAEHLPFRVRIEQGLIAVRDIVGKVWPWILGGIAVGAGAHGYVPQDALLGIMGAGAWWSVPLSVLIGVPLYSNAAGIVPIVSVLLEKGASLGSALAFMMAVIGLSLPETIILRKVLRLPLILVFVGTVALGIMLVGWGFTMMGP